MKPKVKMFSCDNRVALYINGKQIADCETYEYDYLLDRLMKKLGVEFTSEEVEYADFLNEDGEFEFPRELY